MSAVDLLVFGPHPDDLEIGMAATIAIHTAQGARVGLCDLTRGERGTNGTPADRVAEADEASRFLGATWRENLALPDGGLSLAPEQVDAIVALIRRARPPMAAIPYAPDRHPDHVAANSLLRRAIFDAGLRRYPASGDPWRPVRIVEYFINDWRPPSFVVDVSAVYERKRTALACYRSQFAPVADDAAGTRLTSPLFMQLVESRDAQFGALTGARFAEGFVVREPTRFIDLFAATGQRLDSGATA
jgi:bacillithiol biosynthesis deacetylase BshB1